MNLNSIIIYIKKFFVLTIFLFVSGCGSDFLNPDWSQTAEPNAKKRARQNVEEGRGVSGGGLFSGGGSANFEFASSNPLWRASLDVLDFLVFESVDYSGGLIITDWYSENNPEESVKITVRFLTNEIRSDALAISINKKTCENLKCTIQKIESDLEFEIKDKILKKSAYYASLDKKKLDRLRKEKQVPGTKHDRER